MSEAEPDADPAEDSELDPADAADESYQADLKFLALSSELLAQISALDEANRELTPAVARARDKAASAVLLRIERAARRDIPFG